MTRRSTTIRDRARALYKRTKPNCHICGQPIDYQLPHTDPRSFVVDHVVALHRGGADALANLKAAHRQPRLQQREASTHTRAHCETQRGTAIDATERTFRTHVRPPGEGAPRLEAPRPPGLGIFSPRHFSNTLPKARSMVRSRVRLGR